MSGTASAVVSGLADIDVDLDLAADYAAAADGPFAPADPGRTVSAPQVFQTDFDLDVVGASPAVQMDFDVA